MKQMGVSGVQNGPPTVNAQHRCQCVDDLLAPIRSKMKVLKKIKRKMRLHPRNASGGTNNLLPILFHQVHGDNIQISSDGTIARRVESFCRGVTFSSRPIKIQEKVCVKFLEVSNNWSGVIRFGFTSNDPSNLRYSLPKYACPDLTNKPGYWAKALAERFAEKDTILFYYVTQAGDVHFGINGEEKGIFFTGVETRGPLWALFDVYGNSTGIELVDYRAPLNNLRRNGSGDSSNDMVSQMIPSLQSLFIQNPNQRNGGELQTDCSIISRYQQIGNELSPLLLHRTRGQNVHLSNDRCIATRIDTEFCLGYVFTSRPVRLGEEIIIQVLETEPMYAGGLAFGLTSCDPATLQTSDLPEDADSLLDRPEYWVVQKDIANIPQRGDELAFSVLHTGEVQLSKNRGPPIIFMHVDQTLQLWAFFDIYGTTQKIRVLGTISRSYRNQTPSAPLRAEPPANRLRVNLPCPRDQPYTNSSHLVNGNSGNSQVAVNQSNGVPHRYCCASGTSTTQSAPVTSPSAELVQLQPTMGGGTVLVVNIPPAHPAHSNYINHQQQQQQQSSRHTSPTFHSHYSHGAQSNNPSAVDRLPVSSGTLVSNYSNNYIEPVSSNNYSTVDSGVQFSEVVNTTTGSECSICYERAIDSVLYMCGHMCMCYDCAVQQWRGKGGGHCPLCRAVIRDVIRTYKS